ncbi:MAG: hypothetical protein CM15mP55_2640 [Hyphomicrobiales bacterium]|nr:MAG: hypothetical protein CM15mP55_2640 [Hyphomicrobiales bacterium]
MITVPRYCNWRRWRKTGGGRHGLGLAMAEEEGLDLVEVSPNVSPPVCKILDYGKLKYQEQKKASEARKRQKTVDVKEIKMRPNIDKHDYDVKMRSVTKFIGEGDKVKVTMRFRGREMAHQELGMQVLTRVREEVDEIAKVEASPKLEGRQMMMVLAPRTTDFKPNFVFRAGHASDRVCPL